MPEQLPETRFLDMAVKMAEYSTDWAGYEAAKLTAARNGIIAHARTLAELAALKPVPEVDEDAEALARVLKKTFYYSDLILADLQKCSWWPEALAAFKSERPRYTPEQATEIAREICARVTEAVGQIRPAARFRAGQYDTDPEMTFAKAMLLHETGEGK